MAEDVTRIDEILAQNLREYREAGGISQEELARRMSERGYGFSQATIWKIEQNKRPVRLSEAVALAAALGLPRWRSLTDEPQQFKHGVHIDRANEFAYQKYEELKAAATNYIRAQLELTFCVREATDAGESVPEHRRSWLTVPAEQGALEARIEHEHADQDAERIAQVVSQVTAVLREQGYPAVFDPTDIRYE